MDSAHHLIETTFGPAGQAVLAAALAPPLNDLVQISLILLLVFLNGFFVAAEFAIVKVRGTRVQTLVEKGSRRAIMTQHILDHLDAYLSAAQLGITIASILLGAIGESFMRHRVVEPILGHIPGISATVSSGIAFVLGTGIIVFLHVVLGEQAPKCLAIQRSEMTALWVAYPLKWFYMLLYPFIWVLNNSANFVLRLLNIYPDQNQDLVHSEEELRLIMSDSLRTGKLTSDKLTLLENVFDFADVTVRQIMLPRTEIAVFDLRKPLGENLAIAEQTAHSRYPLIDGDLDHVIGVIHMKDLFWRLKDMEMTPQAAAQAVEGRNPMIAGGNLSTKPPASGAEFLSAIAREVLFVPETARINSLLREFQTKRIHMAMVVDEYGGVTGLVTFENVIEEIVGEVQDEFDQEAPRIRQLGDSDYMLDGITTLGEVNSALGLNLSSDEADTISGLVSTMLGRIPRPGDVVRLADVELTVREMRRQRIHRVLAHVLSDEEKKAAAEPPAELQSSNETEF